MEEEESTKQTEESFLLYQEHYLLVFLYQLVYELSLKQEKKFPKMSLLEIFKSFFMFKKKNLWIPYNFK